MEKELSGPRSEKHPGKIVRLDGQRFGFLKVLGREGRRGRHISWRCRCDCGAEAVVSGKYLRSGKKKACGINGHRYRSEVYSGITGRYPSEYASWSSMHQRCKNPKLRSFPYYGGRGIKVCPQWATFENFLRDMGRKPDPKFTIERKDCNGGYEPSNCRWASKAEQARNKRNSVYVTYQGRKLMLLDLLSELGLSRNMVVARLNSGWPLEVALSLPKQKRGVVTGYNTIDKCRGHPEGPAKNPMHATSKKRRKRTPTQAAQK